MKRAMKVILAALAVGAMASTLPAFAVDDLVANPETIFAKGMKVSERNGEDKGIIELRSNGYAIINWNGTIYKGQWEKVDEYHVKTTWDSGDGGPPGGVWSLRPTGNSESPYVAIRKAL